MRSAPALFVLVAAWCAVAAATPEVRYAHGRLTTDVRDVELSALLGAIATAAGFEIRGTPTARRVTLRLDASPVPDAVTRLLEGERVAYTYDRDGGLKRVQFFEVGNEAPRPPVPLPSTVTRPSAPAPAEAGWVAAHDRPVPVDGLLATALGGERSTFLQIVAVALQTSDARLRKEAFRAALALLHAEPDLRAEVSEWLDATSDDALAERLEEVARERAQEIALRTARFSPWRPLRRRAAAVLQRLRTSE